MRKALARLEEAANEEHAEIDRWIEAAFATGQGRRVRALEELQEVRA